MFILVLFCWLPLLSDGSLWGLSGEHIRARHSWEAVGELVNKVLQDGLAGCHLVLAASASPSHVFTDVIRRCSESLLPAAVLEEHRLSRNNTRGLRKEVWTTLRAPCLALFFDISNGAEESLRFLEESELRLWPETRVVVLGSRLEVREVLLHHALRNTRHALYIAPTLPPKTDNAAAMLTEVNAWVKLFKRCLYCNASMAGVQLLYSGLLEASAGEMNNLLSDLYSNAEEKNFQGRRMKVVGLRYKPYTRYLLSPLGPTHPVIPLTSIDFSILYTVAASLNFTFQAKPPKVPQFGLPLGDGNWSGTVGTLQYEEADFSFMLSMTPGRIKVIDYSRIYRPEALCIMSLKPKTLPQYLQLIKPLSGLVWAIAGAFAVFWGVTLWIFRKLTPKGEVVRRSGLFQALLYSWGAMLGDSPAPAPHLTSGRVLLGGWLVFSLILTTAYRSSLIAHLSVLTKLPPINRFEDLLMQEDWTWGIQPLIGSVYLYFAYASDPVRMEVYRKMQYHILEDGMERLLEGRHSYIADQYKAIIAVRSRYTLASGYTPVHISATKYPVFAGVAWGFRRGAPFRRAISSVKQLLIETGLIDYWTDIAVKATTETEIKEGRGRTLQISDQEESDGSSHVVLSLQHLQGIFYLLGLGCYVSFLAFTKEMLSARCRLFP